ncbi:MAG TPA: ABC transporter permease [Acidimicrobiia bacterium]|nr:ABC transporter permease [Acidimicrobiia bacterium]
MRLFTYIGLVLRRIWARKMMLLGSFLGATLVIALLVVLPLYEASVSAVDLLFTFRQAPDESIDLVAVATTTDYTEQFAQNSRAAVDDAAVAIRPWYPTTIERTLSREFVVIPLPHPDWLQLAADWRAAGGLASGEDPPYPRPPREATQVRVFTTADLASQIVLDEGTLIDDQDPTIESDPILQIVIGEDVARLTGLGVGDRTVLRAFTSLAERFELVEVSGIGRPVDPSSSLWDQTDPGMLVFLTSSALSSWSGSFPVPEPNSDPWLRSDRGFGQIQASQTFTLHLDRDAVALENVEDLTRQVKGFTVGLARTEGIRAITRLPAIVDAFDVRTVVFGAPILAMLALIVAGALYFLIYMASLALERESGELALLRMRGASPWQTTGLHLIQSGVIAIAAVLVAPSVARAMVSLTGRIPPMSTLTGGEALGIAHGRSIIPFALAGGILTFVSMGLAILPISRRSVLELRALSTRPARTSVWQRYHLDLFMVVLAAVILYELRQQGIVHTGADSVGLDPFSIAAPALFLFSGALILLRILPWVLKGVGWVMTRFRGMTMALPGWHLGRNPIPYGRLALLVWLTTGFGAFALTYASTLDTSYRDRAAYSAGSDARIVGDGVAYLDIPENVPAAQVFRGVGAPRLASRGSELLGVDPVTFPAVLTWRDDFGASTAVDAFGPETLGPPADWGVELPPDVQLIRVDGVIVPTSWADIAQNGHAEPVRLMARLVDDRGRFRIYAASTSFTDEGWATIDIPLSGGVAINGPFDQTGSLVLQSLWVERDTSTGNVLESGVVLVAGWEAVTPGGATPIGDGVDTEFTGHDGMSVGAADGGYAADQYYSAVPDGEAVPSAGAMTQSPYHRPGTVTSWNLPERNRAQPVPHLRRDGAPLDFVLDRDAASVSGLGVGNTAQFGVENAVVDGTVTGIVDLVPTTGDPTLDGAMVTRLDGLLQWLSPNPPWSLHGTIARSAGPQELWMATDDPNETLRTVLAEYPAEPDLVVTANGVSADFSSRPIQVGLVSILFLGTGAGVVLALAGVTGYVLVAVRRRYREMGVLRALGFRRRGVAGTFALEQVVVLGLGALVGVVAGIGLMRMMIPFLQLGEGARDIIPPAVMTIPMGRLTFYLSVVAILLVVSVLWSTRSVSARRLSEVLREVER